MHRLDHTATDPQGAQFALISPVVHQQYHERAKTSMGDALIFTVFEESLGDRLAGPGVDQLLLVVNTVCA